MCDNCFKEEIKSFPDQVTWDTFDLELTKRLGQGKIKEVQFVRDMFRDKDDGYYIYQCLTCRQGWKMKDPDNTFRGYFLKISILDKIDSFWNKTPAVLRLVVTILILTILSATYFILNN